MHTNLKVELTNILGETIVRLQPIAGGDISEAYVLELQNKKVFCKLNYAQNAHHMFECEQEGLRLISDTGDIKTPELFGCAKLEKGTCLLMEFIETKSATPNDMKKLGIQLAKLHLNRSDNFGLGKDNYIGNLPQANSQYQDWVSFYSRKRLQPQFQLALDKKLLSTLEVPETEHIEKTVGKYCPNIKPGLLHGDLWQGNFLISSEGNPYLIDPAVYYGHHEVDIAMSRLFGGFGNLFYEAYEDVIPRSEGFAQRQELYQLYYLLVHLNLFGRSYYPAVVGIIRKYF